jgi:hypothetical protein
MNNNQMEMQMESKELRLVERAAIALEAVPA